MFFFGKISSDQAVTSCLDWILRNSFWNIWVYQEFEVYIIFQKLFQPFMVEKLSMLCRVGLGCQLCTFSPTHHSRPWSSDNKINDWQRHIGLRSSSWTFNAFGHQPQECPRWSLPRAEESQPHHCTALNQQVFTCHRYFHSPNHLPARSRWICCRCRIKDLGISFLIHALSYWHWLRDQEERNPARNYQM